MVLVIGRTCSPPGKPKDQSHDHPHPPQPPTSGFRSAVQTMAGRAAAAVRDTLARAKARHGYRHMLDCEDHVLRDVGITRADMRQAYHEGGGRG